MSATHSEERATQVRDLPLSEVVPNPKNPRLIFPIDELEVLAESIDQEGILVPITVYPKDGKFMLVDGERRYNRAFQNRARRHDTLSSL
jgi:ParB family transcriptional regulator, chromosome partitioning protein